GPGGVRQRQDHHGHAACPFRRQEDETALFGGAVLKRHAVARHPPAAPGRRQLGRQQRFETAIDPQGHFRIQTAAADAHFQAQRGRRSAGLSAFPPPLPPARLLLGRFWLGGGRNNQSATNPQTLAGGQRVFDDQLEFGSGLHPRY